MKLQWHMPAVVALTLCLLLAGCSHKVTKSNFDKIQTGMTRAQVEEILGPSHQSYESILSWKAEHDQKSITIVLDDQGRVESKDADGLH